jgi:hypothetical protein
MHPYNMLRHIYITLLQKYASLFHWKHIYNFTTKYAPLTTKPHHFGNKNPPYRFSPIFYTLTSHFAVFSHCRDDFSKRQRHPQPSASLPSDYMVDWIAIVTRFWAKQSQRNVSEFNRGDIYLGRKTTLLILVDKGRIPLLTESQEIFRMSQWEHW